MKKASNDFFVKQLLGFFGRHSATLCRLPALSDIESSRYPDRGYNQKSKRFMGNRRVELKKRAKRRARRLGHV